MLRVLPGRSRHIKQRTPGLTPADSPGFDSHSSSNFQEWSALALLVLPTRNFIACVCFCRYLFNEDQCCPAYVLTVKAFEDRRTAADDV